MLQSWKKMLVIATVIAPVTLLTACRNGGDTVEDDGPTLAKPISIIEGVSGNNSELTQRGVFLVKSEDDLAALGAEELYPDDIDFDANDMLVLAAGEMNTGGYWVRITLVSQVGDTLYVNGVANKPGEDELTTQALTYPYHAVLIEKTSATLAVHEIEGVTGQSPAMLEATEQAE